MQIQKVLLDQQLWGPDASALLATLQHWKGLESSVMIFPDRALGGTRYESAEQAKKAVSALSAAFKAAPPKLRAEYQAAFLTSQSRAASFQISVEPLLEDDAFHVVARREGGEFLRPNIEMRTIVERYGKPDKTTTEVVQARGDRRPAILTLHSYGGGAIKFVQSDLAPTVGTVDRVVVKVDAIVAQVY